MMHAQLRLAFSAAAGGTQLHCLQQDPPWKVVRAFPNPAGESLVHLNNVSGGVFGGDRLSLHIKLDARAAAQITTTGSTRVYRPREHAADALQLSEIHIGQGALLEYLPDSIIPFRDARFEQRTDVHLEPGATLFWWEIIAPGRVASGESFAYASLRINTRIWSQGQPIYMDRMSFHPQQAKLSSLARFGSFRYLTSFMICRSSEDAEYLDHPGANAERDRTTAQPCDHPLGRHGSYRGRPAGPRALAFGPAYHGRSFLFLGLGQEVPMRTRRLATAQNLLKENRCALDSTRTGTAIDPRGR